MLGVCEGFGGHGDGQGEPGGRGLERSDGWRGVLGGWRWVWGGECWGGVVAGGWGGP